MSHRGATTSFNARAKALRGKLAGGSGAHGVGTGKATNNPGTSHKLNLSQIKKYLKSESRFKREQERNIDY